MTNAKKALPNSHWVLILSAAVALAALTGCLETYGSGARGQLELSPDALHQYLAKSEIARPTVTQEVMDHLRRGTRYRKRILDQKSRWTLATVWVEEGRENVLHVVTYRDQPCPKCNGTGKRSWNNEFMAKMPFDTECLTCKGKGILPNHTIEKKYVLSSGDFKNPDTGQRIAQTRSFQDAPPETQRQIDLIASDDPQQRIAALMWLDRNYVREGQSFQKYLPMLKKAPWFENPPDKKVMLWQFNAGKGVKGEERRAYYRVYADSHSGEIFRKGFYSAQ